MGTIFNALNIGYSGLKTSQIAIDTTGHNIANAENPDYTRQRVVIEPNTPLNTNPGDLGLGAKVSEIVRIHDEYVYKRLKSASSDNEYNQYRMDTLDELSTYFPEVDKNGIYNGMQEYFNAWNDFSKNTDDNALKINLAQQTRTFTATIRDTYSQVENLGKSLDEQLKTNIDEINRLGKEIADLNNRISTNEAAGNHANDLRDQRDKLELALSKLINIEVSKGDLQADMTVDPNLVESGDEYHLNIGGYSFVDNSTYHPIVYEYKSGDPYGRIYYERQDGVQFDMTESVTGGETGAMLSLRDGDIQNTLDDLNAFTRSLSLYTNNLYASHATTEMAGDAAITGSQVIDNTDLPIQPGSFYVNIYDVDGNTVAQRQIDITAGMTFDDIADQMRADVDDNADNDTTNDVDDFIDVSTDGTFRMWMKDPNNGYTFSLEEADPQNPTLFAGALGMERFFDNSDAKSIALNRTLDDNPTLIGGNMAPIAGDNSLANAMVELQYQKVNIYKPADSKNIYTQDTLSGFFRTAANSVASTTSAAHAAAETSDALLTSVVNEFDSISKVDIDEELTNLMKYQTAYSASAKVITTVDQMIQTLLGIKQ